MHYEQPRLERRRVIALMFPNSTGICPNGYEYNAHDQECNLIEV